ncbi:Chemotaxis response regulator protein-glutamate methylesterase of group 1 operon [Poriferisphaera corsica]|uniref:Protein-glutamate methylesterase/protein-glutamine glutaminase n=1 Tax=Poriferisphaera corsica TaxID=2528020 RepID=A0A517YZ68_9BACT|nr:chemotaxis response regulator protein-glutamate methylesterase [Poriferisphaera corsica]QDU35531.1 Chemotaxis response regulator protein-glutamate methylesterase of group 1 operon [Poriferisphaera corsica]
MKKIKVLVVDDSAFMRRAISGMFEDESDMQVIKIARNGKEAVEYAKEFQPDIITLDIEMPEMDGLTALRRIMRQSPTNVIMISSLTTEGSVASLQALRLGAADVLAKDHATFSTNIQNIKGKLLELCRALAKNNRFRKSSTTTSTAKPLTSARARLLAAMDSKKDITDLPLKIPAYTSSQFDIICIGSSTGGPPALESILTQLPEDFKTPIVIAQHMPRLFTESMAVRLNDICAINVKHIDDGMNIEPGNVYIAPGAKHTHIKKAGLTRRYFRVNDEPTSAVYKPSVDALFQSVAQTLGSRALAIVLTGIGEDGKIGALELHNKGSKIIAQYPDSCVVYGMPKAVTNEKIIDASLSPDNIGQCLKNTLHNQQRKAS